ncbi:MAG: hypothetical protein RLZZ519_1765, partial [Bacteroidota bacterium]
MIHPHPTENNMKKYIKGFWIACGWILLGGLFQQGFSQSAICDGEEVVLTLSGFSGTIQWEYSANLGGPFAPLSGVVGDSASIFPDSSGFYRAVVTSGTCNPFYSDTLE